MPFDEEAVEGDQHQNEPGNDHHVRAVEPDQDGDAVGELGGEPDPYPAEKFTEFEVVPEGLEALLVPFEHGASE